FACSLLSYTPYSLYPFRLSCLFLPGPPTSTLLPYTPLFRSRRQLDRGERLADTDGRDGGSVHDASGVGLRAVGQGRGLHPEHQRDRKSTRLNSSHVKISYAVFCL